MRARVACGREHDVPLSQEKIMLRGQLECRLVPGIVRLMRVYGEDPEIWIVRYAEQRPSGGMFGMSVRLTDDFFICVICFSRTAYNC